jgi:DNA mismatch repair ATPase MutS
MLPFVKEMKEVRHHLLPPFSCYMPWVFNVKHAERNLLEQLGAKTLSAYGLGGENYLISAAGALIEYLRETQKHALSNITSIKVINRNQFMTLDVNAVRNLELLKNNAENKKYGSLLWVLDKTKTGMGARLLARMVLSPLKNAEEINYRLDGVEELFNLDGEKVADRISVKISEVEEDGYRKVLTIVSYDNYEYNWEGVKLSTLNTEGTYKNKQINYFMDYSIFI